MSQSPLAKLYPNKDWAALFTKLGHLMRQDFDWSKDVAEIKSPVMLIFADADTYRTSHIMEFFALLGGGQRDAGLDGSEDQQHGLRFCRTRHTMILFHRPHCIR